MEYGDVIKEVPKYKEFMTVNELNESSRRLAEKHPDLVEFFQVGTSTRGEPIYALRVGEGDYKAILIGFPHPNEPIGSLTIEYLSRRLVEDEDLREGLNFTWYLIKAADLDGARLNEGWFKGRYDNVRHMLNFYRTPGYKQIEWTFPIEYKTLKWDKPSPETGAIMGLIDKVKPNLIFTLHNSAFGGVYFYVSDPCPSLYPKLQNLATSQNLPLHLGEPEAPYMKKLVDAIFLLPPMEEIYDFYEKHSDKDPATILNHGASSQDYAKRVSKAFTIICEMPYIFDEKIVDTTPTSIMRRVAVLKSIEISERIFAIVKEHHDRLENRLDSASPFYDVISDYLKRYKPLIEAKKNWAETDKSLERPATVSEVFDNTVIAKYYSMRMIGQFIRLLDDSIRLSPSLKSELQKERSSLLKELKGLNSEVEKETRCEVIPIQKLVRVQVGTALHATDFLLHTRVM